MIPTLESLDAKLTELLDRAATPVVEPRFFGVEAAAIYSDLSPESIRRLIAAGKLTPLRPVRGRVLIDRRELDTMIAGSTGKPRHGRGRAHNGEVTQ